MLVEFRCERGRARQWMSRAALTVDGRDIPVQIAWTDTATPRPAGLEGLFELERIVLRKGKSSGADQLKQIPKAMQRGANQADVQADLQADLQADVVVDFTTAERDPACSAKLYLRPFFNGAAGEDAALAAILAGDLPVIEIVNELDGSVLDRGHPSAEMAAGLSGGLETVMARTMTMLAAVLPGRPRIVPQLVYPSPGRPSKKLAEYVIRGVAGSIAREIYRLCCYAPHWHVGWRYTDDAGVWRAGDLTGPRWQVIADPNNRFFADPVPMSWQGRTFVFFEDLDHRTNKGTISAIEFDGTGPVGEVIPVLEEPWHLSYPFLIEHDGDLWMIPESSAHGDVPLYKCIRFPDKWERHSTLLSGFELADATITQHNGLNYMFGAWRDGTAGYSDVLAIFYAENLFGPWLPHASNPIMMDRTTTRPAGNFVTIDGKLWRPVQDCTHGYGAALGLAEIVELTPTTYRQIVHHTIQPGPLWPGRKLHTLNRSGRLEVIDGSRIQPKIPAFR